MYNAIVTKLKLREHGNADNIQIGMCFGNQVIVGLDITEDALGIYFPCDGQLSLEFATANDLVTRKDENGVKIGGGFFSEKRRVKAQGFRGEKSEGFWCPLSYLNVLGVDTSKLKEGDTFAELNSIPICNKYETPATKKSQMSGPKNSRKSFPSFPKHIETSQYAYNKDRIPNRSIIVITEKMHGTSGRTGYVKVRENFKNSWWRNLLGLKEKFVEEYRYVNGTRNTIIKDTSNGYYEDESFRATVAERFTGVLHPGEVVYYEIVGYTNSGQRIMPDHPTKSLDKDFRKIWGDHCTYLYGNLPNNCSVYVYRIAITNEKGVTQDLSWSEVKRRCSEMNVDHVPELYTPFIHSGEYVGRLDKFMLDHLIEEYYSGPSVVDKNTHKEGVCLRITPPSGSDYTLKHKNFQFKVMEGIIKDSDDYVDTEESN